MPKSEPQIERGPAGELPSREGRILDADDGPEQGAVPALLHLVIHDRASQPKALAGQHGQWTQSDVAEADQHEPYGAHHQLRAQERGRRQSQDRQHGGGQEHRREKDQDHPGAMTQERGDGEPFHRGCRTPLKASSRTAPSCPGLFPVHRIGARADGSRQDGCRKGDGCPQGGRGGAGHLMGHRDHSL